MSERVLVTGTEGRVGRAIMPGLAEAFDVVKLDIALPDGDVDVGHIRGDVTDFEVVSGAVQRVRPSCIVHLAANANQDAPAVEIIPNYAGFRNVYDAAVGQVSKIVFASSLHTLSGHTGFPNQSPFADGRKFSPSDPPKPGNPYGESKAWAEGRAQQYANMFGLRTIALRLGDLNAANQPASGPDAHFAPIWLSHADAAQGFEKAVHVDPPKLAAVYFLTSDNDSPYDLRPTINDLGYAPTDGIAKS